MHPQFTRTASVLTAGFPHGGRQAGEFVKGAACAATGCLGTPVATSRMCRGIRCAWLSVMSAPDMTARDLRRAAAGGMLSDRRSSAALAAQTPALHLERLEVRCGRILVGVPRWRGTGTLDLARRFSDGCSVYGIAAEGRCGDGWGRMWFFGGVLTAVMVRVSGEADSRNRSRGDSSADLRGAPLKWPSVKRQTT